MFEHKPRLLDLFCGAGGAGMGYHLAGFEVVGVDHKPQPRYPFEFIQGDALEYLRKHGAEFDVIHSSPPCQHYSNATPKQHRAKHPDLIDVVRDELIAAGRPYVIENVSGARDRLINPIMLCGSMFDLKVWRHRYFEVQPTLWFAPAMCRHDEHPVLITGTHRRTNQKRFEYSVAECRQAAGIDWMTRVELDQAIPPAFTKWIGQQLIVDLVRK